MFQYLTPSVHSQYLRDIPSKLDNIIQNVAPGPPRDIATATPPIFPKPTVPDNAVERALKCETSPEESLLVYLPLTRAIECLKALKFTNLK
mgnify:CR=1 FL=1